MEKFKFNVDSALLGELGERLVPSVHIALTELVKNSYDADASEVKISVTYDDHGKPLVEVSDNGSGMTLEEVRGYWMKIGTTNKVNTVSPHYGRIRTGAKGIGRFCCRRLGSNLELSTCALIPAQKLDAVDRKKGNQYEVTRVRFNWLDFSAGRDVSSISSPGESQRQATGSVGTTLRISGAASDEWKQRGFDFIRRQLAILVANNGAKRLGFIEDPGFNVKLQAEGFEGGEGDLREQLIEATWGTLTARIDSKGRAVYTLDSKDARRKTITSKQIFSQLRAAKLEIGIMPDVREDFRDARVLSKHSAEEIAKIWGGVNIRFNGFRVYPYGDPNDDWLGIERDRARRLGKVDTKRDNGQLFEFAKLTSKQDPGRVLLSLLSSSSHIGTVEVDSLSTNLLPKADRLGFDQNQAFNELRDFVRFGIDWATILRDAYMRMNQDDKAEKGRAFMETVLKRDVPQEEVAKEAVTYLRNELTRLSTLLPSKEQKKTQHTILQTTKALEASVEGDQQKLRRLRLIASASTLTLLFAHEIKSLLGIVDTIGSALEQVARKFPAGADKKRLEGLGESVKAAHHRFTDLIELTSIVGTMGKGAATVRLNLQGAVKRAVQCFDVILRSYDIEIDYKKVPRGLAVGPMLQGELFAILLNSLSNAIKSVIAEGSPRLIELSSRSINSRTALEVRDTGVGLRSENFEAVFTTFISDPDGTLYEKLDAKLNPQDRTIFGEGSGLGLSILRDIVQSRKGKVAFIKPEGGWKACLQIQLP